MSKRNRNRQFQPPGNQQQQTTYIAQRQEVRVAPLPRPEELAQFDQVVPGLAERIVKMAEGHAQDAWRTNRAYRWIAIMGQIFVFLLIMSGLAVGTYLTSQGMDVAGVSTIVTAITAPTIALLYRRKK